MATSFAGVTIHLHTDGGLEPEATFQAVYTLTHIPGSDAQVLDYGGKAEGHLQIPCVAYSTGDYDTLRALLGTFGTLIYHGTTTSNVFLASVSSPQRYSKDPDVPVIFTLEFII
jgi:hypothetical protein